MYITNDDLKFLIYLKNRLGEEGGWSEDVCKLWALIERLIAKRDKGRIRTRGLVAKKRKVNKNYARKRNP